MDDYMAKQSVNIVGKVMEVMDDVIQALLAALMKKSTEEQQNILANFADYVANGGTLRTVDIDQEHFEAFEEAAAQADMSYYALSHPDGTVGIILMEQDVAKFNDVVQQMDAAGEPLVKNPQLAYDDFRVRYEDAHISEATIEDPELIDMVKREAAARGMEFAVTQDQNGKYMIHYRKDDEDALRNIGLIQDGPAQAAERARIDSDETSKRNAKTRRA